MGEFINTVDVIGDDALTDSIIVRTVTEFCSDAITQIGYYAFSKCNQLSRVDCPNLTEIKGYAFSGCSMQEIHAPKLISTESYVFNSCKALTSVDFPEATYLGDNCFSGCSVLVSVNAPKLSGIRSRLFWNCSALKRVVFPVATYINNYAFDGCTSLEYADFSAVGSIYGNAFSKTTNLTTLVLRKTDAICTLASGQTFTNTYIYVPAALVDSYKAATNWSTYSAQFRALEDYTVDGTTTGELDPTKI